MNEVFQFGGVRSHLGMMCPSESRARHHRPWTFWEYILHMSMLMGGGQRKVMILVEEEHEVEDAAENDVGEAL